MNCVYDMCATGGQTVALCQAIESYADMCAAAGVPIAWRNNTFCRKSICTCKYYKLLLLYKNRHVLIVININE